MGVVFLAGLVTFLSATSFQGVLIDEITNHPLKNYPIIIKNIHLETDSLGQFNVEVHNVNKITISAPNYYSKTIGIENDTPIYLKPFAYPDKPILVSGKYKGVYSHLEHITPPITLNPISIQSSNSTQQVFNRLPGVIVKSYGGKAGVSTLSFHGGQGNRIAVLLNGFKLNNDQNGSTDISQIPSDLLENIEFIPQGASSRYGSSANTGVINILPTHSPFIFSTSLRNNHFNISNFLQFKNQNYIGGVGIGKQIINDSYSYTETGAYNEDDSSWKKYDWLKSNLNQHFIYGWADWKLKTNFIISSQILQTMNVRIISGFIYNTLPFYPELYDKLSVFSISLTSNNFHYSIGYKSIEMEYYSNSNNQPTISASHVLNKIQHSLSFDFRNLTFNTEFDIAKSKSTDAKDTSRVSQNASIQYSVKEDWGQIGASILVDFEKDKSPVNSYEIYYLFPNHSNITSTLTYSKNHKKPDLNDLYWNNLGNPDLKSEFSHNYYWKNKWKTSNFTFHTDLYFIKYDNLIRWKPRTDAAGLWSPNNIAKAKIYGYHLGLDILSLQLSFDNNYSTDLADLEERPLLYTPEKIISANYSWQFKSFIFSIHGKYTSSRLRQYGVQRLPAYSTIDFSLIRNIYIQGGSIETKFEINNVYDVQFQSVYGYPNPGKEVLLTFKIKGEK